MKKTLIIEQAMELYSIGLAIEKTRQEVKLISEQYGVNSPQTLKKVKEYQRLTLKFNSLEAKHIKESEKVFGISSSDNFSSLSS